MLPAKTQTEILALLEKLQDPEYWSAIMSGAGSELWYATAKVFERVSQAVNRSYEGLTPGTSRIGAYAYGWAVLTRTASGGYPAGTLATGSMLWDINAERVVTLEDATWGAGDATSRVVQVQSNRRSYQANLAVGAILAVNGPSPSPMFDSTIMGAVYDAGLAGGGAANGVGLSGGLMPMLDTLMTDRNMTLRAGETEAMARDRFREVPDNISPAAVLRQAQKEIPAATLHEIVDTWFACNFSAVDGQWNLDAPNAGDRVYAAPYPINAFVIVVPVAQVGDQFPLAVNFGVVNFDAVSCANPALMPDGTWYDVGSPGTRSDIALMAARVSGAKPAGVQWHIEEAA